jgi:hypothetical protein
VIYAGVRPASKAWCYPVAKTLTGHTSLVLLTHEVRLSPISPLSGPPLLYLGTIHDLVVSSSLKTRGHFSSQLPQDMQPSRCMVISTVTPQSASELCFSLSGMKVYSFGVISDSRLKPFHRPEVTICQGHGRKQFESEVT